MSALTTRDLQRFRPLESPLVRLYSDLLALLASNSAAAPPIRDAFHAALSNSDQKSLQASSLDIQLRQLFNDPPRLIIVQGSAITAAQIDNAWTSPLPAKTAQGTVHVSDCIFVNYALHTELVRTKDEGEAEEEANLSMMILSTFAHELAHWIYAKSHGFHRQGLPASPTGSDASTQHSPPFHNSPGAMSPLMRMQTNQSLLSVASIASVFVGKQQDRSDVGDKACIALFGADYELLTYSIGERQLVKRRVSSRRTPSLTPPVIYALTGQTPKVLDVTLESATYPNRIPPWKGHDTMYAVSASLTPSGTLPWHGVCVVSDDQGWNKDRRGSDSSSFSHTLTR